MIFFCLGIDHKSSPLRDREEAFRSRRRIEKACLDVGVSARALFTCNRTEIYGEAADDAAALVITRRICAAFPDVFEKAYIKAGDREVFRHALRLAAGLESQLIGEREILAQLDAWNSTNESPDMYGFWAGILGIARGIREHSGLEGVVSNIAELIRDDLRKRISPHGPRSIAVVGTGKIAELFAENSRSDEEIFFVARKRHKKARRLARRSGAQAVLVSDLPEILSVVDAVVSATSSPHRVLSEKDLAHVTGKRKSDLYIYDLAVPGDVAPGAGDLEGVVLNRLDGLKTVFDEHNASAGRCIAKAEMLVEKAILRREREEKENGTKSRDTYQSVSA